MKEYHKVVTRFTGRRNSIVYAGVVYADERPKSTCLEKRGADIYEDFFDTKGEAELFVRTQKYEMSKN